MIELSTYQNEEFKSTIGASRLKQIIWYYINILIFKSSLFPIYSVKRAILRFFGAQIGPGVIIKPCVNIKYPWKLIIGAHSWIGEAVWIDNLGPVTIAENVVLSQGAMLLTGNHNYKKKSFDLFVTPITLEQGVWIGAFAIVCPGIVCRSNSVLLVHSVATSDLEPNKVYQGNPAHCIRERQLN